MKLCLKLPFKEMGRKADLTARVLSHARDDTARGLPNDDELHNRCADEKNVSQMMSMCGADTLKSQLYDVLFFKPE